MFLHDEGNKNMRMKLENIVETTEHVYMKREIRFTECKTSTMREMRNILCVIRKTKRKMHYVKHGKYEKIIVAD